VQFQRFEDRLFSVGAFIQPEAGKDLPATRRTARVNLENLTPNDAYSVIQTLRHRVGRASFRQINGWLRFSRFDPLTAEACLPLLFDAIQEDESGLNREQLHEMYMEAYRAYFPDGSEDTLDYCIAQLFLAARLDREALELMESSIPEFGKTAERLYVYSLVLLRLERNQEAREVLAEALELNPDFGPAQRLHLRRFGRGEGGEGGDTPTGICVDSRTNESLGRALEVFDESGAVLIDGLFPKTMIKDLYEAYMQGLGERESSNLGAPYQVGHKRMMIPVRLQPPFNDPDLFANPFLIDFLKKLLGDQLILNSFGSVVAYPGAKSQHTHRDHPLLFGSDELDARVPPYAVTVLIPLLDLNEQTGSTQIWEGSHRLGAHDEVKGQPTNGDVRAGSCLAFDYRVYHGGTPTLGESPRPVLYLVYSRPWFRDSKNFFSHPPLPITEGERAALSAEHRPLFRFGGMV
jgi:tetratricopeptide (TPR) repeat protein